MKISHLLVIVFLTYLHLDAKVPIHPQIYVKDSERNQLKQRIEESEKVSHFISEMRKELHPYVVRHEKNPDWIVSRLQMYWNTKYKNVYVNGMDFSHGDGKAPEPTVKFSGSRDWATDYLLPKLEDVKPYMDDPRGMYLQSYKKEGKPWEWVAPSETGHIIENINRKIMRLAEKASFLYWLDRDEKYARFAADIIVKYTAGMHHREAPQTVENHKNALLMGLQTFEVIHEGIIEEYTVSYDFLYHYLVKKGENIDMFQSVFKKWADQEIKYGVPDNNWNLMQARFTIYLAMALENDEAYEDGKGQQYYIDQILNQNSAKQTALKDVLLYYDPETAIWPEVAHYSIMVSDDLLEIYSLLDKSLHNNLLAAYPLLEKAILVNFNYLFPNDYSVAYGDAKHKPLRFNSLELLISYYRKYGYTQKEEQLTQQLNHFIEKKIYQRGKIESLFTLFFYEEELMPSDTAKDNGSMLTPTFYSPNVSWIVQRNGYSEEEGMMVSKNASLGNHSHTNGINIELYAKGMVIAPDAAAGVSYWSQDHIEYYSRFPAHNTVIVDGISDYRNMRGSQAFKVNGVYPETNQPIPFESEYTFSDVSFTEPSTNSLQRRLLGTVRTSPSSGYFIDIFRSAKQDGMDKKHEYLFHSQGEGILLKGTANEVLTQNMTDELSSKKGDLIGYDYFKAKKRVSYDKDFVARFSMPSLHDNMVNVDLWMKGYEGREIFTVKAPYSRAIHKNTVHPALYHKASPTLIVRQKGEAYKRPFVSVIDAYNTGDKVRVKNVSYFSNQHQSSGFIGMIVSSSNNQVDYIFNNSTDEPSQSEEGTFKGDLGLVSIQDGRMKSMLLGKGSELSTEGWRITSSADSAYILVKRTPSGVIIDASHAFSLEVPMTLFDGKAAFTILQGKREYIGTKKGNDLVCFKFQPLNGVELTFK